MKEWLDRWRRRLRWWRWGEYRGQMAGEGPPDVKAAAARLRAEFTPEEQAFLDLRVDMGLTWKAVAEAMGLPGPEGEAEAQRRFERLRKKLAARARELGLLDP